MKTSQVALLLVCIVAVVAVISHIIQSQQTK